MMFIVTALMLLLVAATVYPPLGRKLRDLGRKVEEQRNSGWGLRKKAAPPPAPARQVDQLVQPSSTEPAEKPVFGKRVPIEEPKRPTHPMPAQIFSKEIFEGQAGALLREVGFAPDDPGNQTANSAPLSVLLAEDQAHMRRVLEAGNASPTAKTYGIIAWHLFPPALWHGRFGPWLRQALDLSPYRPWNTIFLPSTQTGADALGLPIAPPQANEPSEQITTMIEIVADVYASKEPPEAATVKIMLDAARSSFPQLFPKEVADYSERIRQARSDVRALAFIITATGGAIEKDVILKSQQMFLGDPDRQLVA